MRPAQIVHDEASRWPGGATTMMASQGDRRLLGAFLVGAGTGPATIALAWLWMTLAPPPPCSSSFLCFRGLGEALISLLLVAVAAGIVAQVVARDLVGWLAMIGGILALAFAYALLVPPPGGADKGFTLLIVLIGVPATAGYLVARGFTWLWQHSP